MLLLKLFVFALAVPTVRIYNMPLCAFHNLIHCPKFPRLYIWLCWLLLGNQLVVQVQVVLFRLPYALVLVLLPILSCWLLSSIITIMIIIILTVSLLLSSLLLWLPLLLLLLLPILRCSPWSNSQHRTLVVLLRGHPVFHTLATYDFSAATCQLHFAVCKKMKSLHGFLNPLWINANST